MKKKIVRVDFKRAPEELSRESHRNQPDRSGEEKVLEFHSGRTIDLAKWHRSVIADYERGKKNNP